MSANSGKIEPLVRLDQIALGAVAAGGKRHAKIEITTHVTLRCGGQSLCNERVLCGIAKLGGLGKLVLVNPNGRHGGYPRIMRAPLIPPLGKIPKVRGLATQASWAHLGQQLVNISGKICTQKVLGNSVVFRLSHCKGLMRTLRRTKYVE